MANGRGGEDMSKGYQKVWKKKKIKNQLHLSLNLGSFFT